MRAAGHPAPSDPSESLVSFIQVVSPGYFDVMRLGLRAGRLFTRLDGPGSPGGRRRQRDPRARGLRRRPAVGRQVLLGEQPLEVIGVVADILYSGLGTTETWAEAFLPMHQTETVAGLSPSSPFISIRTDR